MTVVSTPNAQPTESGYVEIQEVEFTGSPVTVTFDANFSSAPNVVATVQGDGIRSAVISSGTTFDSTQVDIDVEGTSHAYVKVLAIGE